MILREEDEGLWLSDRILTDKDLEKLFRPFPSGFMVSYPVSSSVNSVKNDTEGLIVPASSDGLKQQPIPIADSDPI